MFTKEQELVDLALEDEDWDDGAVGRLVKLIGLQVGGGAELRCEAGQACHQEDAHPGQLSGVCCGAWHTEAKARLEDSDYSQRRAADAVCHRLLLLGRQRRLATCVCWSKICSIGCFTLVVVVLRFWYVG